MATRIPVQFVDAEDSALSLGWIAMPVAPQPGDGVQLPGMLLGEAVWRRWEFLDVPDTVSMRDADLYRPGFRTWVAVVALGNWDEE